MLVFPRRPALNSGSDEVSLLHVGRTQCDHLTPRRYGLAQGGPHPFVVYNDRYYGGAVNPCSNSNPDPNEGISRTLGQRVSKVPPRQVVRREASNLRLQCRFWTAHWQNGPRAPRTVSLSEYPVSMSSLRSSQIMYQPLFTTSR